MNAKRLLVNSMIFFVLSGVFSISAHAVAYQGGDYWAKSYGGSAYDKAKAVQQTSDGGFILVGWGDSFSVNGTDIWVVKLDSNGQVEWQRAYVGSQRDNAQAVKQTNDGGYVIVGWTSSFSQGHAANGFIMKLDAQGDILWQRRYPGEEYKPTYFRDVEIDQEGDFVVAGAVDTDILVMKVSQGNGEIIWEKLYGKRLDGSYSHDPVDDEAHSIKRTSDGGYIVAGSTSFFGCGSVWHNHYWLLKLDGDGNLLWNRELGVTSNCDDSVAYAVAELADGSFVAAGEAIYNGNHGAYIVKLDKNGGLEWGKLFSSEGSDGAYGVEATNDGGFIAVGRTGYFGLASHLWLMKFSAAGDIEWQKAYGANHSAIGYEVKQLPDGSYLAVGMSPHAHTNFWLLKVDNNGNILDCPIAKDLNITGISYGWVSINDREIEVWAQPVQAAQADFQAVATNAQSLEQCYAEVNQPPIIDSFAAEPTYGVIPFDVTFTCTAHDQDGSIAEYQWDFDGDGVVDATTTNGTVSHTYDTVGSYDATCTAVDDAGASAISSPVTILAGNHYRELNNFEIYWYHPGNYDAVVNIVLYIVANLNQESRDIGLVINDLKVSFSYDQQYFLPWTTIPFDITGNNTEIDSTLGGQYGYFSDPRDAYVLSDEAVLDGDTVTRTITRLFGSTWATTNQPPVIDSFAVEPTSGTAPLDVAVICQAHDPDGTVTTYEFNPGDGSNPLTGTDGTFSYTYETPGTYQATCTAYDDQGASVTSDPVAVTVTAAMPAWQDISGMVGVSRSRTLFDRVHHDFFVMLDLTNLSGEDLTGPVRMVLLNNTLALNEAGPGLDPDGYTQDGHPYFLIVPEGGTWAAGQTLEDLRLDFVRQRTRLDFDLRFEMLARVRGA